MTTLIAVVYTLSDNNIIKLDECGISANSACTQLEQATSISTWRGSPQPLIASSEPASRCCAVLLRAAVVCFQHDQVIATVAGQREAGHLLGQLEELEGETVNECVTVCMV